jgi:hypothetical protein
MLKKGFTLLIVVALPLILFAQTESFRQNWYKDWRLGTRGGISYLATELKKDLSKTAMDMNVNPTGAFDLYLDKRITNNLEVGIEFEKNFFEAQRTFPDRINWLMYDIRFNNETSKFIAAPVYSKTNLSSWFLNLSYNFVKAHNVRQTPSNLNMYVKAGVGFSSIGVELGYIDPLNYEKSHLPNPIYEKGQGIHSLKDFYASFHFGTGINYYLSPRISINSELMFLIVSNDYLDGVHNYDATKLPDGTTSLNRMEVVSIAGELKVGISYHFNLYKKSLFNGLWEKRYEEFTNKFYHQKEVSDSIASRH